MMPTRYAPFIKRFVAFLVDTFLGVLVARVLLVPLRLVTEPFFSFGEPFRHWGIPGELVRSFAVPPWVSGGSGTLLGWSTFVVLVLYFSVFESSWRQATPGKMLFGMFVTDDAGRRLSFGRALGRSLAKLPSAACCFIGYAMALFTSRSQALHDLIANTLVLEPYGDR